MEHSGSNKLKLLRLMDIMLKYTDSEHHLTIKEIIQMLEKQGISVERKTLYSDIEYLNDYGLGIEKEQEGREWGYYVTNRTFELPEIKLLVDAIQNSKFISETNSEKLIKKLENFVSEYEAGKINRQVTLFESNKTGNEKVFYSVDSIYTAINDNVMIEFKYFDWNLKKEKELRHEGMIYRVSPFKLVWDDENYYLVAYDDKDKIIKHYRVDKMVDIRFTNIKRQGQKEYEALDVAAYNKKVFGMFTGDTVNVTLLCKNRLIGVIIDQFGTDVMIIPKDNDCFSTTVEVVLSPRFIGWLLSFKDEIILTGPSDIKDYVKEYAGKIAEIYK